LKFCINLLLWTLLIVNQDACSSLPPKGKTQFITQVYLNVLSKGLESAISRRTQFESSYARDKSFLYKIDNDESLTPEQKFHKIQKLQRTILRPLEQAISITPGSYDSLLHSSVIESRSSERSSLGIKILFAKSHDIAKHVSYVFQTSLFSKIQIYSNKNNLLLLSPEITFEPSGLRDAALRLIYSGSNSSKLLSRIFQLQIGAGHSLYGPKFMLDSGIGLKYQGDIMLLLQEFYTLDVKNPSKLYQKTLKSQLSISKAIGRMTLQLGYFSQTSLMHKMPLSSGIFSGIWCYF
jgi:hypothetical protein